MIAHLQSSRRLFAAYAVRDFYAAKVSDAIVATPRVRSTDRAGTARPSATPSTTTPSGTHAMSGEVVNHVR